LTYLRDLLQRHRCIALDTCIFIYQIEANPQYVSVTAEIFNWLEQAACSGVTSAITMTELLVRPYQERDNQRVDQFYSLFSTFPNLEWKVLTLEIADLAARFRADYRLRTPDAIQAATAAHAGATGFFTNDFSFKRIETFETLILDTLVSDRA
jgi:predicted nucleic acid-binding protein